MKALPHFTPPSAAQACRPAKAAKAAEAGKVVSSFSEFSNQSERENKCKMPLAAKLRAYGRPWPLVVGGEVKCFLVADDEAAKRVEADEAIYTADEVMQLVKLAASDVQNLHVLKTKLNGTIQGSEDDEN